MNTTTVLAIMIGTVLVTVLLVRRWQDRVVERYQRLRFVRRVGGAFIAVLIAWTLINSGEPLLMLIAVIGLASATVYWYIERPDEKVV